MTIVQEFEKDALVQTETSIKKVFELTKFDKIFVQSGELVEILELTKTSGFGYRFVFRDNILYIGKNHEFKLWSYNDLYPNKTIIRSKEREQKALNEYKEIYKNLHRNSYTFQQLLDTNLFSKAILYSIYKGQNLNTKDIISKEKFFNEYVSYYEKIRKRRIEISRQLKNIPTNPVYFINTPLKGKKLWKYALPNQKAFCFNNKSVPIDPYLLGYWLGDGFSFNNIICGHQDDMQCLKEYLLKNNITFVEKKYKTEGNVTRLKLKNNLTRPILRKLNLLDNKHIPEDYLYNSITNRLELLAGLIDSDGCVDKNGNIEITVSNNKLAEDIYRLIYSLGIQVNGIHKKQSYYRKNGICFKGKITNRIHFTSTVIPLNLKRKKNRLRLDRINKTLYNFLYKAEEVDNLDLVTLKINSLCNVIPIKNLNSAVEHITQ